MTFVESTPSALAQGPDRFRAAMRRLFGGVSIITVGNGDTRTGLTVTSTVPLSTDPPVILICVNRSSSSWPVIVAERRFCVNVLDARHEAVAERFSGRGGAKGPARYHGAEWRQFVTGAWGLADALAVIDCAVEELVERHSHAIVIGQVLHVEIGAGEQALLYGHGRYRAIDLD
jgi:flavin reductase (DIM6/NTAB) family NADH-FMN oxidoreductase RutF